jgi:hypothetical protein
MTFTGANAADFSQTSNCGTALSGGASCTINVTFTPKGINNRAATLNIADSAPGGLQTVAITGKATAALLSPTSLTFGPQAVGTTSVAQVVTLTNVSGGSTITITSIGTTGTNATDFQETNTCSSVPPKKTCTISVTFTPSATGTRTASLSIADNAGSSPQTVPLTGTGTATVFVNPTSLAFPTQVLGTSSTAQNVTLTNAGATTLTITSIAFSGANATDFSQTNNCGTSLAGNSTCTISVVFKPININHRSATLTITDSAGTQTVTLSGTSTAASFSPTSLTFAAQTVGTTSAAQTITMSNASGGTSISITSLTITTGSDFAQTNTCGTSLLPKKSCTISVTFTPTATGTRSASVSVTDNAGSSPQTIPLTGTGQ